MAYNTKNEDGAYYNESLIPGIGDLYKSRELCEEYEDSCESGEGTPYPCSVKITHKDGKN